MADIGALFARMGIAGGVASDLTVTRVVMEGGGRPAAPRVVSKRCPMQVLFVIDESASMHGHKFREAVEGARSVLAGLRAKDWVGLYTFATVTREMVAPGEKQKREEVMLRELDSMLAAGPQGDSTALYKAVDAVSRQFVPARESIKELQYELVVVTDGGDNASKETTAAAVAAALAEKKRTTLPTLHVTVLAVGVEEAGRRGMRDMVGGVGEVHDVGSGEQTLRTVFADVVAPGIEERSRVLSVQILQVEQRGPRAAAPALRPPKEM